MKSNFKILLSLWMILMMVSGCENDPNDFQTANYSKNGEVFIDNFSAGLNYAAFSNTVTSAFQVDNDVTYNNSSSSMRIDVPNVNDPLGAYAGGAFFTTVGRDLSGYDALTFWAKSSVAATLDVVGFGIDLGANKYPASINGVSLTTTWRKYIIPIPDASKLKIEKGMFYFSEGPENGNGYTFWFDEVKFEKLGTIAHGQASILNGVNKVQTTYNGVNSTIDGLISTFNLPNGINQPVNISASYLEFSSSNPSVATVNEFGVVTTISQGTAIITAKLNGQPATGSLTINSDGVFTPAPLPTQNASNVISLFSNVYNNVPVDFFNGYYGGQTTQTSNLTIENDDFKYYSNLNYVGIEFNNPSVNATSMTFLHLDILGSTNTTTPFIIKIRDRGANGVLNTNVSTGAPTLDDREISYTVPPSQIIAGHWLSINIPLNGAIASQKNNLAQIVFVGNLNFFLDNLYFYN